MTGKVVTIVGARPQFIKAATVSRAFKAIKGWQELLVHTGQHYDDNMSQVFFDELDIPRPKYHLGIGSGSHGAQTGRMLEAIEQVLLDEQPDWVLVYGDTNSTLAGALAAVKLHVSIAHVEAGLRSFNRRMPEEINRVATDHVADLLFAPTETAVGNLQQEGIPDARVKRVGDVMYDAALYYASKAEQQSRILDRLDLEPAQYILGTIHRAENTDDPKRLRAVVVALETLDAKMPVVLPLHPRTRHALTREGLLERASHHLRIIEPVGYIDMVMLEKNARLIATDSGGVQKEAFFHRVPCVTLRDETEWVELVESGWNRLAPPTDEISVSTAIRDALAEEGKKPPATAIYGDGDAAAEISRLLAAA